jgi:hypothetical protein
MASPPSPLPPPRTPHPRLRPVLRAKAGGGRPRTYLTLVRAPVLRGGSPPAGPRSHLSPNQPHRYTCVSPRIFSTVWWLVRVVRPPPESPLPGGWRGVPATPRCYHGELCVVGVPFFFFFLKLELYSTSAKYTLYSACTTFVIILTIVHYPTRSSSHVLASGREQRDQQNLGSYLRGRTVM